MSNQHLTPEAIFQQAVLAHQSGQSQEAIRLLQELLEQIPDNDGVLASLGAIHLSVGDVPTGLPFLEKALSHNPANVDARVNLGIALQNTGQIAQGLDHLKLAVEQAPERVDIRFNLANILLQFQRYEEAIRQLQAAIQTDAGFLPAYQTLGAVYGFLQQPGKVQDTYQQALTAVPNDLQTMVLLANSFADTGQVEAATEAYQHLVDTHPQHFLPYAVQGKFLVDIGELTEGKVALEQARSLQPNDLNTNILLGNVHRDLGHTDQAEHFYREALRINPNNMGALINLRRLMSVKIPYWHFEMLADSHRNDAYEKALKKAVKPGSRVLDIGTGSGLLSMMAARAGAGQVVACEMHERLAQTAQEIVALNGFSESIQVHHKKSTLLHIGQELPERVDVVVSEILDVGALGEGVLPSIRHAVKQLAKPNATLIPAAIKIWGQLIEIPARSKVAPVREVSGFDLSPFEQYRVPNEYLRVVLKAEKYKALSPVMPLLDIDFYELPPAFPDDQPRQVPLDFPISTAGTLQAIIFWFDLYLDKDIMVSSRPDGELEHWGQALFCFPNPKAVGAGSTVPVVLLQSDQVIRFALP